MKYLAYLIIVFSSSAFSCSCLDFNAEEWAYKYETIILARNKGKNIFLSISKNRYTFQPVEVLKGEVGDKIFVWSDGIFGSMCGTSFSQGQEYLLFINKYNGRYIAGRCNSIQKDTEKGAYMYNESKRFLTSKASNSPAGLDSLRSPLL
ncbi:hypothetical protein [Marinibactrum halimedae]|uniref:hypothetical protein n=1 Tax=Marinibactrum halimedae TaxID=1444977 RepID=UPI001E595FEB|nr:hypothetical protein [Marinibactrum halimedae]MCD9461365.1 hypothetical protein [Marinibactrum halimedae]